MTLRCGLVGTGHWTRCALLPALRDQAGVIVTGCVAGSLAEASSFTHTENAGQAFASLEDMLASTAKPDMVVIATPDHAHAAALTMALQAGVAAYCEKPLANDLATARALAGLAERTGIAATVGFSFRFNPAIQALKRDLVAGRLGEPWLIELAEHNPQFHPSGGKPMNWKGDPGQAAGGALFEYGSHVIDLAAWLLGPITAVASRLHRVLPGARLDDIATMQMSFASGASGTLVASWLLNGGFPGIRIRLHGSRALGEVQVDDGLPGGQRYALSAPFGAAPAEQPLPPLQGIQTDAPRRHLAAFVASLRGEAFPADTLPTLQQGADVQAVLDAALAATTAWQPVGFGDPV